MLCAQVPTIVASANTSLATTVSVCSTVPLSSAGIRVEVWDKDLVGKDFMGETIVPIELLQKGLLRSIVLWLTVASRTERTQLTPVVHHIGGCAETWYPLLEKPGKKSDVAGEILLRFAVCVRVADR
jgi:hypothetical protein